MHSEDGGHPTTALGGGASWEHQRKVFGKVDINVKVFIVSNL